MIKTLLSCLSFLLALALSLAALHVFFRCILPWRKAPDTMHMTMIFAGMQFIGWQLLIPLVVFIAVALTFAFIGLWMLKRQA
jgi:hypothetical protein